jgi:hypothetical protein
MTVLWFGWREEAAAVEIQVGEDRSSRDGRAPRDSSPFDFAQGQNDGEGLSEWWRERGSRYRAKAHSCDETEQ